MRARTGGAALALLFAGCTKPDDLPPPLAPRVAAVDATVLFQPQPIGAPVVGMPWIAHLRAADLDRDGLVDVLVCDARANTVSWVRQTAAGIFSEITLAADIPAPVHVEAVDLDGDGDLDLLVASLGQIFPNNDRIGAVIVLENDGPQRFTKRILLDRVARVSDVQAADLDGDGRLDLVVGQFGYDQGEIRWMKNLGGWRFESRPLLNLSGTINVCIADFTGDGQPDIAALVSQQWEEIHLFTHDGRGGFTGKVIFGSTNEDFASSGLRLADLNRDGRPDLLFTNGDGFGPTPQPGPRPWHGVQWLENLGAGKFAFHRIADLPGAYSPVGVDLDGDGATDVVALSAFNTWDQPGAVSMVWYRNDGRQKFTPHILAHRPTHLLTIDTADFTGDGRPAIVAGAFHAYPPYRDMSRLTLWRRAGP
ncbi:MAG: VCBS repeat-containing protein [Opitutaceae bacterium]|nr:VCBS repeat-containing protein [Opitutaceae bacterium]